MVKMEQSLEVTRLETDIKQSLTPESKAGSTQIKTFSSIHYGRYSDVLFVITEKVDLIFALCSVVFRIRNYLDGQIRNYLSVSVSLIGYDFFEIIISSGLLFL
jgi:hypothetical protein